MRNCSLLVSGILLTMAPMSVHAAGKNSLERVETRVDRKEIPAGVRYEFSRTVGAGRLVKSEHGTPGSVNRVYDVHFKDGKPYKKVLVREERIEPKPTLMLMGSVGYQASRGSFSRGHVRKMSASAYDPSPRTIGPGATGRAANGMKAGFGMVAVDPRVIPLGTLLYVEGYGFALAADKGSAIKGNKIDLCFTTRAEALRFGRKQVVVHVLKAAK